MDAAAREVLDQLEHAVFVLEPGMDGAPRYAAFNRHACQILGRPEAEILGLTAVQVYPGRLGKVAFGHHVAAMRLGTPRTYELLLPVQSSQRLIRTSLVPVHDPDGKVIRLIGSSTDASGWQIFREMRAEMETISGESEDFISMAAHDLRAPMRNVKAIASMLREDLQGAGDETLGLVDALEDLGEKAMRLIGDVLDHAQATSSVEQEVEFDLAELVQEIMALLDPMGRCAMRCREVQMQCDRTAMQIILRNLIDNAIKHADSNDFCTRSQSAVPLELHIDARIDGDEHVAVEVVDNGKGFSDPALLFLEGGRLRNDSGFGLLGIRRLIHARGGTLTVFRPPGEGGAAVIFTLPGSIVAGRRQFRPPEARTIKGSPGLPSSAASQIGAVLPGRHSNR